jgi:predicted transcriptional regulator
LPSDTEYVITLAMPLAPGQIRLRREALGLSTREAARLAGMHQPAWVRIEVDAKANPTLSTLESVARVLGCGIGELVIQPKRKAVNRGEHRK